MAFDERKAQRVTRFIEALKHTKGEFHGKPFVLLPWQEKVSRIRELLTNCSRLQRNI